LHSRDQEQQIHDLLNMGIPPSAIFTSTDELALRVLKIAQNRHVHIPEDLAIIGFDDIEFASYLELTTISQSLYKSGKLAAEHLIAEILDPSRPLGNTFIPLTLIERKTT